MGQRTETRLHDQVTEYLQAVRAQRSHTGKVLQFIRFLERTFGLTPTDYEVEEPVGHLQVRGWIDTVIGDTLFEFKTNLSRELDDAVSQLRRYLQDFHSRMPNRRSVGIATDGVRFRVYQPEFKDARLVELAVIEDQDLSRLAPEDAVLWLDRYLFRLTPKAPTERDISQRLGAQSPTYKLTLSALERWWETVKEDPAVALKYEVWTKQLTIVYGEGIGTEALFLQHTYLATLAKLLASVVFRQPALASETDIITGSYFQALGIQNFIEEDLFAWVLHPQILPEASSIIHDLRSQLSQYEPSGFTEDVLKGLYQQLVDPQTRQLLGEFYTPDWLAQYMLEETLRPNAEARVLDPACGSGTFLFLAVRLVIAAMTRNRVPGRRILEHLERNIVGIDVHPLAVLIARTNYLIAAAPLLAKRVRPFSVPVFLGDSLMYRSAVGTMFIPDVNVPADGETLWFPGTLSADPRLFDEVVNSLVYWAEQAEGGKEGFERFLGKQPLGPAEARMLLDSFEVMSGLFTAGRDSIWRFIIRNLIRPYILSRGSPFNIVIGNPPWLSLRYIKSRDYQTFVKRQMEAHHIKPKGAKLVTQLELATLFFAETATRYLKDKGTIAFVMPRSIMIHKQHEEFLKFRFGPVGARCDRLIDLEDVRPLFSVPACVLFATKGEPTSYPVPRIMFSGLLPRKNASWQEAKPRLKVSKTTWAPAKMAEKSPYYEDFRQGATIVPRRCWFVRVVVDPNLGFDTSAPLVESDASLPTKKPWHDVFLHGQVEAQFLYGTVISTDLLPFVLQRVRPVVLPVEIDYAGAPCLLNAVEAMKMGYPNLSAWLRQVEREWKSRKTDASPGEITEYIDYLGKLTAQFPQTRRYVVVYASAAREMVAAVVDTRPGFKLPVNGSEVNLAGLAAEHQVYWFATDNRDEAHYLCGWLNSGAVDEAVRPRELWGKHRERHLEKRPLELPLPRFSSQNSDHAEMAELARKASAVTLRIAGHLTSRSLGSVRRAIRGHKDIRPLLSRIDELARKIGGL